MQGLLKEGQEMMSANGDPDTRDAALIASAQRVEHYEMAGYGCARTFAKQLVERLQEVRHLGAPFDETGELAAQRQIRRPSGPWPALAVRNRTCGGSPGDRFGRFAEPLSRRRRRPR